MSPDRSQTLEALEGRLLYATCSFDPLGIKAVDNIQECFDAKIQVINCYFEELKKIKADPSYAQGWADPCNTQGLFPEFVVEHPPEPVPTPLPEDQIQEAFRTGEIELEKAQAEQARLKIEYAQRVEWYNNLPPFHKEICEWMERGE